MQRLFVYGSLAPGKINAHLLDGIDGTWEEATVRGVLHSSGWGANFGFPGLVLSKEGVKVSGHLFCSNELTDHWEILDEFEGESYNRILAEVTLRDNSTVDAYIYTVEIE